MAINTSPTHLLENFEKGEQKRDRALESLAEQIHRYHGEWFMGEGPGEVEPDPENFAYSYLSAFIPSTVHSPPRVKINSRRPTAQKQVAKALQAGINRWVRDTSFVDVLEQLAYDFYFRWFCALVSVKPRPDSYGLNPDPLLMPAVERLSPRDCGWDAEAPHPSEARLIWHKWRIDKDDLVELAKQDRNLSRKDRAGWNIKAIQQLQPGFEPDDSRNHNEFWVDRNQVELIDMYVPDDQPDDTKGPEEGFFGSFRTLAYGQGADPGQKKEPMLIRAARPHFGPCPYVVAGCYLVPDESTPLSPLVATQGQSDTLNAYVASMIRDAESFVNKIFVAGEDPQTAQRIKDSQHNEIAVLPNLTDLHQRIAQFTMGGVDPSRFQIAGWLRDMLERVSGFNDVSQGQITGEGTATEVTFAQDAASARSDYPRNKFVRGVQEILKKVAEFMYRTDQIIFPLGREGLEAYGTDTPVPEGVEAWFVGGLTEEGSGGTFQDLELVLQVDSMVRTSQAELRRRSEVIVEFTTQVLPVWLQIPGLDIRTATQTYGDLNNVPELLEIINLEEIAKQPLQPMPMLSKQAGTLSSSPGFYDRAPVLARAATHPNTLDLGNQQAGGQQGPSAASPTPRPVMT